jgi:5-methylcytosine-specific restriction endonuclease McrA
MVASALNKACLILNQNYEPLSITNIKRAISLIYLGKAEAIESYSFAVHAISSSFTAPSVLRLLYYINIKRPSLSLNKRNILKRDNYTCQYCGTKSGQMTADHVIPKSLGGKDTWDNLVCACVKCNNEKGDRTPEMVKMKLVRPPKYPHFFFILHNLLNIPDSRWKQYLFLG